MHPEQNISWRSPEAIVEIGIQRAPVVMMNEAHSGMQRCIRTRQIGQRVLPVAHQAGVRHLAFVIDQIITVQFGQNQFDDQLLQELYEELNAHGGTAGFLVEQAPSSLSGMDHADAILLSTENELE